MKTDRILPGKLTITRPSTGDSREVIRFIVRDERSRSNVLTFEIGLKEFALALTGMGEQPIGAMWTYLERLGKQMETKTEQIELNELLASTFAIPPDKCLAYVEPFEVAGWKARLTDLNDPRRRVRNGVQAVTFFRWVDAPEEEHAFTCAKCGSHVTTWSDDVYRCQSCGAPYPKGKTPPKTDAPS